MISPKAWDDLKNLVSLGGVVQIEASVLREVIKEKEILCHALNLAPLTAVEIQQILKRLEARYDERHTA